MKPVRTGVWLYTPKNFDASSVPELRGFENEAHWLLHKVISLNVMYRHEDQQYVRISRKTMEEFIHVRVVGKVKRGLEDYGVIECDGRFVKGERSMGYRLGDGYSGAVKRIEVTKKSLAAKVLRHRLKYNDRPVTEAELGEVYRHLLGWLRRVRIDIERAYDLIDAMDSKPRKRRSKRSAKRRRAKIVKRLADPIHAKAMNKMTCETISHVDWEMSVCR